MEDYCTALITGASSGIGAAFARELAARGHDLVLVARRQERLEALASELQAQHGVSAQAMVADLARPADVERVAERIAGLERLDLLINNAGFGTVGRFARIDVGKQLDMIHVHVIASVRLCRAALPGMIERRRGGIVNVASVAAFIPLVGNSVYAGTKAFLIAFSRALQSELEGSGVRVQALCPGFTYSEFHDTPEYAGKFKRSQLPKFMWMPAEDVVAGSLRALERGRVVYVPGLLNRLMVGVAGIPFVAPLMARMLVKRRG